MRLLYIPFVALRNGIQTQKSWGERLRVTFEQLGPIFVKFGQLLSTRRDMLSDNMADELAKLQDRVPPFPSDQAQAMIEKALGKPIHELFQSFDPIPLASASIAQVHAARLWDGREVVIKVLRPRVMQTIKRDVSLLYTMARLLHRIGPKVIRRLRLEDAVAEFESNILGELDLTREAANASQLKRNFIHSDLLYVPEIYWPYVRNSVMVMERISGIPIMNVEDLKAHGVNMRLLAERGVEIFFTQVFYHCFFHADMHPGNIFVSYLNPNDPQYIAVDFGIMGSLTQQDQRYLAENLLAFFKRDYRRVAELHVESGWVSPDTRVDQFEADIRAICEPAFEQPLREISVAQMLLRLFQAAGRFHMEIQPQLLLLQKTLLNVEGLGRHLYPELDLWSTAQPFLERWVKEQLGVKGFIRKMRDNIPYWMDKLPEMPDMIYELIKYQKAEQLRQQTQLHTAAPVQKRTGFWRGFIWGAVIILAGVACMQRDVIQNLF